MPGTDTIEYMPLLPRRNLWVRTSPNQWPHEVKRLLQGASGQESCDCDEILRTWMSETSEADVKTKWQEYISGDAVQNGPDSIVMPMCQLIHLTPNVAGMLLDFSLKAEETDIMSLKGKIKNSPMRSKYINTGEFVGVADVEEADHDVHEVTRYRCLLPNILNINLLQALATTEAVDVLAKRSIQAMLSFIWDEQVVQVIKIKLVLCILEVMTLSLWGLTTKEGYPLDRIFWFTQHNATNEVWLEQYAGLQTQQPALWSRVKAHSGDCFAPIKWNIIAALNLEQFVEICCMWHNRRQRSKSADECTKDLWSSRTWRSPMWLNSASVHWLIRTLFLISVLVPLNDDNVMVYSQQLMLSLAYCTSVLGMFTFFTCFASEFDLSLVSVRKTIMDAAVMHFIRLLSLIFLIMMVAWMMLDREDVLLEALATGWRAFFLLSEDAIKEISNVPAEPVKDEKEVHGFGFVAQGGTFVALFFFSTFLTNLLIAIFSEAYSKARKKVWLTFFKRRAKISRNCIMARPANLSQRLPKCQWAVDTISQRLQKFPWATAIVVVAMASLLQIGVCISLQKHHNVRGALSTVSIIAFALMVCMLKATPFKFINGENIWFSTKLDLTKPDEKHELIVWCRKDFNEEIWLNSEGNTQKITSEISDVKADLRKITLNSEGNTQKINEISDLKADLRKITQEISGLKDMLEMIVNPHQLSNQI